MRLTPKQAKDNPRSGKDERTVHTPTQYY